jgi:hypothetical protein
MMVNRDGLFAIKPEAKGGESQHAARLATREWKTTAEF